MTLADSGSTVPSSIQRYLMPRERLVITVRKHPVTLLASLGMLLGGLVAVLLLTGTIAHGLVLAAIWVAWLLALLYFLRKITEWSVGYFIVTDLRIMLIFGTLTRKVAMMPLSKITDISFYRSFTSRLFGYGDLIIESADENQALRTVNYLPYSEELYLQIFALLVREITCPTCGGKGTITQDPTVLAEEEQETEPPD
jgi:hypothetical protein